MRAMRTSSRPTPPVILGIRVALVNLNGEVIGSNAAIIAPSGGNVGIGLAIPSTWPEKTNSSHMAKSKRAQLGVTIQDLTPDLAKILRINVVMGAVVIEVMPARPPTRL